MTNHNPPPKKAPYYGPSPCGCYNSTVIMNGNYEIHGQKILHQYFQCQSCQMTWLSQQQESKFDASLIKALAESQTRLQAQLACAKTALEMYAMTNETFPEYGDTARAALAKINSLDGVG